ncbi:DUF58 domain-containing protein [Streptomyces sp. NP160]|uniref:DUF58 domain-containing protein n=1 Tax=Streptomyces sp. NP160 TaxID=2586637 RepID=UPI001117C0E8|nr:DUF58 domain-containing protein [Streptomyces sp. NP160]TNM64228.1 DUF58 domain-containing protein [Streptomyces sp. NP160]
MRRVPGWRWTASPATAVGLGVLLASAGLALGRPDVALLGAPLLVTAALGWQRPAAELAGEAGVEVDVETAAQEAGSGSRRVDHRTRLLVPAGAEAALVRLVVVGGRSRTLVVAPSTSELHGSVQLLGVSGPQEVVRATLGLVAVDGGLVSGPVGPVSAERVLAPVFAPATDLPLPPGLRGLSGVHDSSRPGQGGDFRDIGPFAPGDRLRRIDWRATARRSRTAGEVTDLYVRRSLATSDAVAVVVVDSRDDVGEVVAQWGANRADRRGVSSLHLARQAASAIAAGTVRRGDRVAFCDLLAAGRSTEVGSGDRHLRRVLAAVATTRATGVLAGVRRLPPVPPSALVYVLSTFLDDVAGGAARTWRSRGHRVVAVDVLPAPRLGGTTAAQRLAHQVVALEREDRLEDLRAVGVEVVSWAGAGGAAGRRAQLRALSRRRSR